MSLKAFAIDDDVDMLGMYQESLEKMKGLVVEPYEGPMEAIKAIKELGRVPDFFILDHRMSSMTGLDFLNYLEAVNIRRPTILVSGWLEKSDVISMANSGVKCILEKPFDPNALFDAVKKVTSSSHLEKVDDSVLDLQERCCDLLKELRGVRNKRLENIEQRVFSYCGKLYGNTAETARFLDTIADEKSLHQSIDQLIIELEAARKKSNT